MKLSDDEINIILYDTAKHAHVSEIAAMAAQAIRQLMEDLDIAKSELHCAIQIKERAVAELMECVAERDRYKGALRPFAKLELPRDPKGNAGMYSLLHKDIIKAKQALEQTNDK